MMTQKKNDGFSLIELLTVMAIVAVLGAIAVPNIFFYITNRGLQSAASDLYSNMRKAQSFAVKFNRNCAITFNGTTGYVLYVDENKNFKNDAGERVLAQENWSKYRNVQFDSANFQPNASGDATIAFQPNLLPVEYSGSTPNGTAKLKNSTPREFKVVVSVSGNISLQ